MISRAFDGQPEGLTRDDVLANITLTWLQTREAEMALARILDGPLIRRVEEGRMEDNTLVQSSFSATINAPMEKVDIPSWCFTLPESEYQSCSPAHVSAGSTTAPDGRRMSINVEVLGGSMIVQHYVEEIGQPDHLRLVSASDVFEIGRAHV